MKGGLVVNASMRGKYKSLFDYRKEVAADASQFLDADVHRGFLGVVFKCR